MAEEVVETPIGLKFGVEIECYIRPSITVGDMELNLVKAGIFNAKDCGSEAMSVAYWLHDEYRKWQIIQGQSDYSMQLNPKDYARALAGNPKPTDDELKLLKKSYGERIDCWGVEQDMTLKKAQGQYETEIFALEFVSSPIEVNFNTDSPFRIAERHITRFFQFFADTNIKIFTRTDCSTHVHLSPIFNNGKTEWTFPLVKRIGMCSVWFEPAIRYLLPTTRRFSPYAQEYRDNEFWKIQETNPEKKAVIVEKKMRQTDLPSSVDHYKEMLVAFQALDGVEENKEDALVNLSKRLQSSSGGSDRYAGWNYWNIYNKKNPDPTVKPIGTIEFRQPPGCANSADVLGWIKFAVAFSYQACRYGDELRIALYKMNTELLEARYLCSEAGLQDFLSRDGLLKLCDLNLVDFITKQWEFVRWVNVKRVQTESLKGLTLAEYKKKLDQAMQEYNDNEKKAAEEKEDKEKKWQD